MGFASGNAKECRAVGDSRVFIAGSFTTAGDGTVSAITGEGFYATRVSTGLYRVTLPDIYTRILSILASPFSGSTQDLKLQVQAETEATQVIDIQAYEGSDAQTVILPVPSDTSDARTEEWPKTAADAAAADATAEHPIFRAPAGMTVSSVHFLSAAGITGHADHHATMTVAKRDGAGGGATTVATYTTDSDTVGQGTTTANVPAAFSVVAADAALAAGGILTLAIAKGGNGVVVPAGLFVVTYTLAHPLKATSEVPIYRAPAAMLVNGVHWVGGAVTGHADNFASLLVAKRDGAGGSSSSVASFATDTDVNGSITANVPAAFTNGSVGNRTLAAGNILTWQITKSGTGVLVPAGELVLEYSDTRIADIVSGGVQVFVTVEDS